MEKLENFKSAMEEQGMSRNTINTYLIHFKEYLNWFESSYDIPFKKLYKVNILEYKAFLKNIKKVGKDLHPLDAKSINVKLSALSKYRELLETDNMIDFDSLYIRVQTSAVAPTDLTKNDVEQFRQSILQSDDRNSWRNYAIVTLLMYSGIRISELVYIKNIDIDINNCELKISDGKGEKQRIVILNKKIVDAIFEYKNHSLSTRTYLFEVSPGKPMNRSTINKIFNKYSDVITPHTLRHYFCSTTLGSGNFTINEVAAMAGHKDPRTTLKYANPTKKFMKEKLDNL